MTNTDAVATNWTRCHDKYGRYSVQLNREGAPWRPAAIVVTLPKTVGPLRYLCNLWCLGLQWEDGRLANDEVRVTYHPSSRAAKAWAESMAARLLDNLPADVREWDPLQLCAQIERAGRDVQSAQAPIETLDRLRVAADDPGRLEALARLEAAEEDYNRLCAERINRSFVLV